MGELRFRNTDLSREQWYRELKPVFKCVWDFICDSCDKAGMWSVDIGAIDFFLNDDKKFTQDDFCKFMEAVNGDKETDETHRIEWYGDKKKKVWITGFTAFQYGKLSSASKPHEKIILLLNSYSLLHRVPVRVSDRVYDTLQERKGREGKGKEDREEENTEFTPEQIPEPLRKLAVKKPNIIPENSNPRAEKEHYEIEILPTLDNIDDTAKKIKLAEYIRVKKPGFIEPYMDLWNLSAIGTGLSTTKTINEGRERKFKTRIKEPAFDFIKILEEIKQSNHLRGLNGHPWKATFDWFIENDSNYVKTIEGQYRNKN